MISRLLFGLLFVVLLISAGKPQVGPLPGMAVLTPPFAAGGGGCTGAPSVTSIGTNNNTSGATITLTGVTVPAGSFIGILVGENSGSGPASGSVSDGTNSYSPGEIKSIVGIFFSPNVTALSGATITYTKAVSGSETSISAFYSSNIKTTSPSESGASNSGTSASPSVTSGTPSESGDLFMAGVFGKAATSFTQDTTDGWAAPPNSIMGSATILGGGTLVGGSAAKTFAPTLGASTSWDAVVEVFIHC